MTRRLLTARDCPVPLVLAAIAADDAARRRPRPTLAARVQAAAAVAIVRRLDALAAFLVELRRDIAAENA